MRVACFPKLGDYNFVLNMLIERTLGYEMKTCPPITKRTVELGAKNSPDTVCTPFKVITGNFIEAIERGVNTFFMPAFGCRLGFYDILHKQILQDLGYEFEMLTLFDYYASENKLFNSLHGYNPDLTREKFEEVLGVVVRIVIDMDGLADIKRRNASFEENKGEHEKNYLRYLAEAKKLTDKESAIALGNKYREIFSKIKINKPDKPIRIGLIGDLYSVIEPHGNCEIEKWLMKNNVEIIRKIDLTYLSTSLFDVRALIEKSGQYVNYSIGGNANNTIALANELASSGVDGIIHMKAATCTPEITAMSILQNISKDFGVPIMYLTFDTETSEAGLHTRWEAFLDMINMKRSIK